ncbi:MAG: hypothetical protein K6F93_08840 [Lachnospiraceae bacterium]|nr:hypothetical protein [Lachnospiraceae bacterium]
MKKRGMGLFIAMGGIALVLIVASIFLIVSGSYTARLVLVNDGFFVGETVRDSLYANDENAVMTSIPAITASQSDILYEKSGKYYLGDNYTPVSLNYPYVINNASAVMFTSNVDKLLTGTFEYVDSYENLYMSGGVTFNSDMERAYREDFILVDTGNGVYMNANKLTVGGALTTAGEVPANSFIRFLEDRVDYYYYEDDKLVYASISPVSRTATIETGSYSYSYIEFLEKLGLYSERKVKEKISPTPTPVPVNEESEDLPAPTREVIFVSDTSSGSGDDTDDELDKAEKSTSSDEGRKTSEQTTDPLPAGDDVRDDDGERESVTPDPAERPTRAPRPTSVPSIPEPAGDPLPAEDVDVVRVTPTPRPTATPLPTPTLIPPLEQTVSGGDPYVPEAPAPGGAAAAASPVKPPELIPKQETGNPQRPVYFTEWKKPVVHLGDITTGTYTIFLDNFHIENAQFIYKRYGVEIYVKKGTDENGELVYTKSVTGSGPLRLAQPFEPEEKYTLKVVLNYINAFGETVAEDIMQFGDVVVETKSRDFLDKLDLTFAKAKKAPNSFKINDLGIGIAVNKTNDKFIESVEYMGRFEITATNAADPNDVRILTLSSSELEKLRRGEKFNYESSRVFRSNSTYNYVIKIYDKTGALLKFDDGSGNGVESISGVFKTCTEAPNAVFRVLNNKIYDYTVAMRMTNSGNAGMKNIKYRITDINGNEVLTTVKYLTTVTGAGVTYTAPEGPLSEHLFTDAQVDGIFDSSAGASGINPNRMVEVATQFTDLSDQTVYKLQVIADYDIYDYDEADYEGGIVPESEKWHVGEVIGETRFTTASISSLGNLFLDNIIPETDENLNEGNLYMTLRLGDRTNDLLIDLLDDVTIGFYKNKKDENGVETGVYELDTDARISYILSDASETQYSDIKSVLSKTRPDELAEWEETANKAAQLAYDQVMNTAYADCYSEVRQNHKFIEIDEQGVEKEYTLDDYYSAAANAQTELNSGNYATEGDEYKILTAIVDKYSDALAEIESEAMTLLRTKADEAKTTAYEASMATHNIADPGQYYKNGEFSFGSSHAGYTEGTIDSLKELSPENTTGGVVPYKYKNELRIVVTGLSTNSTYNIKVKSKATVGTSGKESEVRTTLSRTSFKTYRKKARIKMDAYYAASDFISLFGVSIDDPDGAISSYPVTLTMMNRVGTTMGTRTFNGPQDTFDEIRFSGLTREEVYSIMFLAKEYNKGWTKASSEINKELFVNDNTETLMIVTHESIKADISLIGINEAYDLAPEVRVMVKRGTTSVTAGPITGKYSTEENGTPTTYLNKGSLGSGEYYIAGADGKDKLIYRTAVYTIDVDLGDESYNIIEPAIYPTRNRFTKYQLFEDEACTIPLSDASDPNARVEVTSDTSNGVARSRSYWTSNYIRLNKYLTGSVRVYLRATALNIGNAIGGASPKFNGVYMLTGVSFHKFGEKAYTANINAVLKDEYGQLGEGGVSTYYVRVYEKEGESVSSDSGYALVSERMHTWRELEKDEAREHTGDNCLLSMCEYDKYALDGKGEDLGQKTFVGGSKQIDTNFGVRVAYGKYYRLELWIKINNYNIRVGTSVFTSDRFIHSIEDENDLLDAYCHPSDSYIVTKDLKINIANIYNTKQFDGVLDFNGHTLVHTSNEYLIHTLGAYGEVKNIVYEKGVGDPNVYDNLKNVRGITYANYGRIDNVIINYKNRIETIWITDENGNRVRSARNASDFRESSYIQGMCSYANYPTGIIENFCVNVEEDIYLYGGNGLGLVTYINYGLVRNGYSCSTTGAKIHQLALQSDYEIIFENKTTAKTNYTTSYYTGGLVRQNIGGIIESTFGLVDMDLKADTTDGRYKKGAVLCGKNDGFVRNSFSAAKVLTLNESDATVSNPYYEAKQGRSPAVRNFIEGNNIYGYSKNVYHYGMGLDYGICLDYRGFDYDSVEIRKEILYDVNWYKSLFESDDITRPGQWDYDYVARNCYPHVRLPECMPAQPDIALPAITSIGTSIIPLAAMVTENNDTEAYATVTFYNPSTLVINNVSLDYANGRVIEQWEDGKFYYARIRVQNPSRYLSSYRITGIRYSLRGETKTYEREFTEEAQRIPLRVEFFKPVRTVGDFIDISADLEQNYMLGNDIDFTGYFAADFVVGAKTTDGTLDSKYTQEDDDRCFSGKFDGRNHAIRNIDVGNVGFVFSKVSGSISNLKVENIHTMNQEIYGATLSTAKYMGLVGIFRQGASLDNVHVDGARFENITQFCGVLLARNFFENKITNCSVRNVYLSTGLPSENSTAASVGCLVGHNDLGLIINNCYVDNYEINAKQAGDVYGIGGAVGYTINGIKLENVYAVRGKINTYYSNVGGLVGSVQSINDVSTSSKSNYYTNEYFIKNYYTDCEIYTMANNIGGVIGYTSKLSGWDYNYGIAFGRIVPKSNSVDLATLGPIVGYYSETPVDDKSGLRLGKNQYVYSDYEIGGTPFVPHSGDETETSRNAYFKTLSYGEITTSEIVNGSQTYGWEDALLRPRLAWKGNYEIDEEELQKGILPKLYYSYKDENGANMLLPGQQDFSLKPAEIEIVDVTISDYNGDNANSIPRITAKFEHDKSICVNGYDENSNKVLTFEGTEWFEPEANVTVTSGQPDESGRIVTTVTGLLKLKGDDDGVVFAVDKYFIKSIRYKKSSVATMSAIEAQTAITGGADSSLLVDKEREIYYEIKGINSGWIYISSADDWNAKMSANKYGLKGFNIYLTGDLEFNDTINNAQMNVVVNNIIGKKLGMSGDLENADGTYNTANTVTIKNVNIYKDDESGNASSFIEQVLGKMEGITFENCSVSQTYKKAVTEKKVSNKTALIGIVNGKINCVTMKNIDITAFRSANIAPIAFAYGVSTNIEISDINVVQHKAGSYISTYSNRGGYVSFMGKFAGIDGLNAERIYIDASGAYIGGIVGNQLGGTYLWNINAKDIVAFSRSSSSFVGGIIGSAKDRGIRQRAGMLHIEDVFVRGGSYIGGIAGRLFLGGWDSDGYRRVTGTGISALNDYYALDLGTSSSNSVRSWVKRGFVASMTNGSYVGGSIGIGGAWKTTVEDTSVFGGTYTGGIVGLYAAIDCDVRNSFISHWYEKVGGNSLNSITADNWPSMAYRPGDSYKNLYSNDISGKTYTSYVTNKTNVDNHFTDHDAEQDVGEGKYFDWKDSVMTNVNAESDNAVKTLRGDFWNQATWGMTSYSKNFGVQERTNGRSGIVINKLKDRLPSDMQASDKTPIGNLSSDRMLTYLTYASVYNALNSTCNDYIGGIAGRGTSIRGAAVLDSMVYSPKSTFVGGIAGGAAYYDGNYTSMGGYYSLMVGNTHVVGGKNVGGVFGETYRYNTVRVFVDEKTIVEGRTYTASGRDGTNVGGIAGYVRMGSSSASEHPQFDYIISGATVIGNNKVAGMIGYMNVDFYTDESESGWAMLGKVIVNGTDINKGDLIINKDSDINYINKSVILGTSTIEAISNPVDTTTNTIVANATASTKKTASMYWTPLTPNRQTRLQVIDAADLKNKATYTGKLGMADSSGITSGNYKDKMFIYDKLGDGYLPYFSMGAVIQSNFDQGKVGMFPGTDSSGKSRTVMLPIPGISTGSGNAGNEVNGALISFLGIPEARLYTSGVDTISVDFSHIDPTYTWTISMGDKVISGVVDQKTISFTYDFASDVTVVVSGADGEKVVASSGSELANYVSAAGGSYNMITGEGIVRGSGSSSLPTRYGDYVNLYDGKALERDGSIIDLETGVVTSAVDRATSLGDERTPEPLAKGEFGGFRIETFASYSVTTNVATGESSIRDEFLFYTDGKTLQSIRTSERIKPDSVILYSDLENTYFAALGSDRKLNVLLDGAFKVPDGISVENIYEMSSSREIRAPYCIMRYSNGGVCAFNFVTGEILYEKDANRGLAVGGGSASSGSSAISFSRAMELNDALKSGSINLKGIILASPIDKNNGGAARPAIDGEFVEGGANNPNGNFTFVKEGEAVNGNATEVGEIGADGLTVISEESERNKAEIAGNSSGNVGEPDEKNVGEQPETTEGGASSDSSESGVAIVPDLSGTATGIEGALPVEGEVPLGNYDGNTINGTNSQNGSVAVENGVVIEPIGGDPNSQIGSNVVESSLVSVDPKLLASVESEASSLIEDGSISIETITEVLGTTESEAKTKLYGAAAQIADRDGFSIRDAITEAYKDIVLNPTEYKEEPIAALKHTAETVNAITFKRDLEIAKQTLMGGDSIDPSTLNLVTVFNPETGEYELFDMNELLAGEEEQLKSLEERLAESGRFIDTSHAFRSGAEKSKASRDYNGFIAVIAAVLLAGGLTCALIYKKRKEGSR